MLAYLFWHRPEDPEGYEGGLVEFHRRLIEARVPGLRGSACYRVRVPWLGGEPGYEDWYLVDGYAELGTLNEAAVAPALREYHDRPALAAAGGAGGLYALRSGEIDLREPVVSWLAKPKGMAYPAFYASLPPLRWLLRRQLVFGPAPEFCAAGEAGGLSVRREAVFVSA